MARATKRAEPTTKPAAATGWIASRSQALAASLRRRRELRENVDHAKGFADAASELAECRDLIVKHARRRLVYEARKAAPAPGELEKLATLAAVVRKLLTALLEGFKADRGSWLEKAIVSRRDLAARAEKFDEKSSEAFERAWVLYCTARAPRVDDASLELFRKIAGFASVVTEVAELRRQLMAAQARLAETEEDFRKFDDLCDRLTRAWEKIDETRVPREVRAFLREAAAGGAEILKLTEVVRAWLVDNGVTGGFRITLADTARPAR